MKISIFAGVLLISAALISVDGQTWDWFQHKHINAGMTSGQCTMVIAARGIVDPHGGCKGLNTFITGSVNNIPFICSPVGGTPYYGYRISYATFPIVDCYLVNPNAVPPYCQYNGVGPNNRRIIIACRNGQPVHFHGSRV
uniref:Ribonuclease A-domain domain-containing protein n=1 Tax=Sander lucioperca TaxID=283035 RepID=A0A8C9ZF93_SANLU